MPCTEAPSSVTQTEVLVKTTLAKIKSVSDLEKTMRVMFDDGSEKTRLERDLWMNFTSTELQLLDKVL